MPPQSQVIAGVTVPDTPLITKAIAFARQHLPDQAYNHVMRSWLTCHLLVTRLPSEVQQQIDTELYAIAIILHDLGWSKSAELISKDKCFEVDGANCAREFVKREGNPAEWDKHRLQLLWDVIALHTTPGIGAHKEIEVALACGGIMTELLGPEVARGNMGEVITVTGEEMKRIAEEFPREGLREYLKDTICGFCREKPQTTYWNFQSGYGEEFVEGYNLEGKRMVDVMLKYMKE
ncbi:hypothetical protein M011DRAFT_461237 [Sporormia fimetaria CBS 119925]|uniref:HD domain-containing protein n=1 Tax=Sporormia fimetaria CBS 119925 TaxID=1340428 RepID=A0A6A6V476_9PLEO|nr:hypothetical protein M011DRAFT_461237 [Sporormia fimetaria CBS 119925]